MKKGIDYTGITIVYFCHDGNGNFVMNRRSVNCRDEHGCWDIGAGALEYGDTVESTLKKEIFEEYCTEVVKFDFLGYRDIHRIQTDGKKSHWIGLDFAVLVDKNMVANGEPHKFDAVEWFSLNKMPSPLHSQLSYFLEKYKNQINTLIY